MSVLAFAFALASSKKPEAFVFALSWQPEAGSFFHAVRTFRSLSADSVPTRSSRSAGCIGLARHSK